MSVTSQTVLLRLQNLLFRTSKAKGEVNLTANILYFKLSYFFWEEVNMNALSYEWSDQSSDSAITASSEGMYWVKASGLLCTSIDTIKVFYIECPEDLLIPNVFTPNHDAINDNFEIKGIKHGDWKLEIYNRWGELIYKNIGYKNDWMQMGKIMEYTFII